MLAITRGNIGMRTDGCREAMAVTSDFIRRLGARRIVLIGFAYWLLVSVYLLVLLGDELDADAVFPFVGQENTAIAFSDEATPSNPPISVLYAFFLVTITVVFPAVLPSRFTAIALRITSVVVGICLLVSILRLGLMLAPVLALQLLALSRCDSTSSAH